MRAQAAQAAFWTAVATIAGAVIVTLGQRSSKRLDNDAAAAERAANRLEEARQKLLEVKDDHIAMLSADLAECQRQRAELAAKVASYEERTPRKDDT